MHWVGLSDEEATWEPWGNLINKISLIEFLQHHTLKSVRNLVPKDYWKSFKYVLFCTKYSNVLIVCNSR